jgi:hypothetical protein
MTLNQSRRFRITGRWPLIFLSVVVVYVLSSGPVLAIAFWLREATHWDGFYLVMYLYFPLLVFGQTTLVDGYIEWWVELFGTVGPG